MNKLDGIVERIDSSYGIVWSDKTSILVNQERLFKDMNWMVIRIRELENKIKELEVNWNDAEECDWRSRELAYEEYKKENENGL